MPAMLSGPVTARPLTMTAPAVAGHNPVTTFIRVDFPQPEGPTTAANSPSLTCRVAPCNASVPSAPSPYRNETRSRSTKFIATLLSPVPAIRDRCCCEADDRVHFRPRQCGDGERAGMKRALIEAAICSEEVKRNRRHGSMLAIVDDHAKLEYADVSSLNMANAW